jgi:hypothetical protein
LRWEDDVIQDIKTLGVKNWRKLAMEKESWQKRLGKARAHVGCRADDDDDDDGGLKFMTHFKKAQVINVWESLP